MLYYIIDEIHLKPDALQTFLKRFNEAYVVAAEKRGQKLVGSWQDPAFELEGKASTFFALWSVADSTIHYNLRRETGQDRSVAEWWTECEQYQESRKRRIVTSTSLSPMQ